jgi:hypothetical protein
MQIKLLKPLLIGTRNHAVGDILDSEIDLNHKKSLIEKGLAVKHEPKPVEVPPVPPVEEKKAVLPKETASIRAIETATVKTKGA